MKEHMPNQRAKPNLRRRRLGALLRDCRNEAGLTLEAASAQMGWDDHTRLSNIENARRHINAKELDRLLGSYGITDKEYIAALAGLAKDAGKSGWWAPYGDAIATAYADYISVEADADAIKFWAPTVVPGLLQTAPYAREVIAATTSYTPEKIDAKVDVRMARQSVLTRAERPLTFYAVISEAVLHQEFASNPEAMRDQLRHLLYLTDRPTITIQIMPTTVAHHPGLLGLFSVVSFPDPWPALVQLESLNGGSFIEDSGDVAEFESAYERIVAAALPVDTSREAIKKIMEEKHP
jgi:transcriptional regulator with XRE-family HTH domain